MTLSGRVDAMIIVTRLNTVRRPMLTEVHRLLESCPAAKLGFILTAAEREEGYGYGGYYYGAYATGDPLERKVFERA